MMFALFYPKTNEICSPARFDSVEEARLFCINEEYEELTPEGNDCPAFLDLITGNVIVVREIIKMS